MFHFASVFHIYSVLDVTCLFYSLRSRITSRQQPQILAYVEILDKWLIHPSPHALIRSVGHFCSEEKMSTWEPCGEYSRQKKNRGVTHGRTIG